MKVSAVSLMVLFALVLTEGCRFNGVTYKIGDTYNMEPCTWCRCGQNNRPECMSALCAMPRCRDNVQAVRQNGECCPRCPEGSEEPFSLYEPRQRRSSLSDVL